MYCTKILNHSLEKEKRKKSRKLGGTQSSLSSRNLQPFDESILLDIAGITPNSFGVLLTNRKARDAKVLCDVLDHKSAETRVCDEGDRNRQVNEYRSPLWC
jgi:hypothetical protein